MTVRRKKGVVLTPGQVLDWVFEHVGKDALEALEKDPSFVAFCESRDEEHSVDLDGDDREAWKRLRGKFETFKAAAAREATKLEADAGPTKTLKLEQPDTEADVDAEADVDEEGGDDEDDESAVRVFQVLRAGATPLCAAVLDLEETMNPIVVEIARVSRSNSDIRQANKTATVKRVERQMPQVRAELVAKHGGAVSAACTAIQTACVKPGPADCLQLYRIIETFEYRELFDLKDLAQDARKLDRVITSALEEAEAEASPDWRRTLVEHAHAQISKVWNVSLKELDVELSSVRFAVHGASAQSKPATSRQQYAGLGEVLLCMPLLVRCHQVASGHGALYQWDPRALIVKLLQKTVRKHKLSSLLGVIEHIDRLKDRLLLERAIGIITPDAYAWLSEHLYRLVTGAVAGKAREQRRQLTVMVEVLWGDPTVTCTGYELVRMPMRPALDLCLWCATSPGKHVVVIGEVESVPRKFRTDAWGYLKRRLAVKRNTLRGLLVEGEGLSLMVPDAHLLPPDQVEAIENDNDLPAWLVYGRAERRLLASGHPAAQVLRDAVRAMLALAIEMFSEARAPAEPREALYDVYLRLRQLIEAEELLIDEELVGFVERTAAAAARLRDGAVPGSRLTVFVDLAALVNQLESCVPG